MSSAATERRTDLDWVRIAAFALLIVYHVGMYYVSWGWHVKSPAASTTLEPLMLLTAPWRLSLLFLVSGVATAFLIGKSETGFVASRSKRLLIPLAFGMLVIVPPQSYFEVVEKLGFAGGYGAFWIRYIAADSGFCPESECLILPTWNHLWFVAYLWVYTLVVSAALRFAPALTRQACGWLASALSGVGALLLPFALLAVLRVSLAGVFPSTHALFDDWYNHSLYLSMFVLGFLLAREQAVWATFERLRWPALMFAATSYAFVAWYFSTYVDPVTPPALLRHVQRVIYALNQWTAIVAILGFARRVAPADGPLRRYLTEAVFPLYILHQTVIILLSQVLKPLGWAPSSEGPVLVIGTFAICFGIFELVRRVDWLRPLFGLRRRGYSSGPSTGHTTAGLQSAS